jgi:hypothetical protein
MSGDVNAQLQWTASIIASLSWPRSFGQFEQEPLAEAVMRRGQEENSHGVSPLFFCLQEAVGNILVSTVKDRNRAR